MSAWERITPKKNTARRNTYAKKYYQKHRSRILKQARVSRKKLIEVKLMNAMNSISKKEQEWTKFKEESGVDWL